MLNIKSIITAVAALAATACSSDEAEMPENPADKVIGDEVSKNVIYQANPRFFGENECLNGITAQLPRISGMDCDILWIMPVYEPGELNGIGSPYCIRDFKALNPRYGTMDDMKNLVNAAHSKGMRVILDWVADHTAWDCGWITLHPDWYRHDAEGNIVSPEGWNDVAQLDFHSTGVREAMKEAMLFWVTQTGIDGYRCDYAEGVPHDFWSDVIKELRAVRPDMLMLAETSDPAYFSDGFDMIYDWKSATTISAAFHGGRPASVVTEAAEALGKVPGGKSILRYVFNHDVAAENDVATMYGAPEGVPAAYVLASMLNGTPMIYSSMDVAGLSGKLSFFDYTCMDFSSALSDEYRAINAAFRASAEVRRGELADYSTASAVCFTRTIPGHNLLVAVNTTGSDCTVKTPIHLAGTTMTDLTEGESRTVPVAIELEAYGYIIMMN